MYSELSICKNKLEKKGFKLDFILTLISFWLHSASDKDDNDTHTLLTLYSLAQHAKMQIRAVQ